MNISDQRRYFEIAAVLLTAAGKFIFMDFLDFRFPFILLAILFWIIYIFTQSKKKPGILKYWGWRFDNFNTVLQLVLPFGLIALVVLILFGYFKNTLNLTWHIFPILLLYPIWGSIQQFLCVGLVAGNLQDVKGKKISSIAIILITSILFSGLHAPDYSLVFGTFVLAMFYTFIYLKNRNIYVLGLFHGWLGAIFYYTVVDRDPFLEVFGSFLGSP